MVPKRVRNGLTTYRDFRIRLLFYEIKLRTWLKMQEASIIDFETIEVPSKIKQS